MSTCGEIVKEVLNVAMAGDNWANLGRKPSICLVGKDRADQCSPGDSIFIREEEGSHESTVNRVAIFTKDYCTIRIVQSNHDDRENALADIITMLENASYALVIRSYSKENRGSNFIMNLRVEVSNI